MSQKCVFNLDFYHCSYILVMFWWFFIQY